MNMKFWQFLARFVNVFVNFCVLFSVFTKLYLNINTIVVMLTSYPSVINPWWCLSREEFLVEGWPLAPSLAPALGVLSFGTRGFPEVCEYKGPWLKVLTLLRHRQYYKIFEKLFVFFNFFLRKFQKWGGGKLYLQQRLFG